MFDIKLIRKNVKNMILKIDCHGNISLTVPKSLTERYINIFLESKKEWIKSRLEKRSATIKLYSPLKERSLYILGESHDFSTLFTYIYKENSQITPDFEKKIVKNFLLDISKKHINPIIEKYLELMELNCEHISYKFMKTRWGSCNFNKRYLNFNSILISSPLDAIEYVVVHELTHLLHPHHGKEFWNHVEKFLPDWKSRRKKLIFYEL